MAKTNSPLVIVGLSGGVDSAVAAWRLRNAGYRVEGLFMENWEVDDAWCTNEQDYTAAQEVARHLDIVLHKANFATAYRRQVFSDFIEEYSAGRTPNPDVLCNREIKFGEFLSYAKRLGADFIATGHYARLKQISGRTCLFKGADENKDQSYFLHAVTEAAFRQTIFPLGDLTKPTVRRLARDAGLPNHDRQDSTGICFIGERPFRQFLAQYLPPKPGVILDTNGRQVGRHDGLHFFTRGQRAGLNIGGQSAGNNLPWYVVTKDVTRNVLIVAQGHDNPNLLDAGLVATNPHWINELPSLAKPHLSARMRHRQRAEGVTLISINEKGFELAFNNPIRAVTPGQYVVLYDGNRCLGGGRIAQTYALTSARGYDAARDSKSLSALA